MNVPRETTLIIAPTVPQARAITERMGNGAVHRIPLSPRSIRQGAGRGFGNVASILVCDSVWPLPVDVELQLAPYTALGAQIARIAG